MSDLITRTARLVPYAKRPKQVASFVTAYSYEPLANEPGAELGSLFVVMEVLVSGRASEEVADLIIETIGNSYYNEPPAETPPPERFERAVKAVNHELTEHVNRGNAAWIGKLSAVVAVQAGSEIHVASTGSAEAYLYRGKSSSHITGGEVARPATPNKTFGSIASGQLEPEDRLLLATPALIHQVPLSKLQSVIGQSSPNAAIAEITGLLHGSSTERIAAQIIQVTTPELAALQVRSDHPNEIRLGSPENALEAAKLAAAPIAQTTVASGKKMAGAAHTSWKRTKPRLQSFGLAAANKARQILSTKNGRRAALIALGVLALVAAGLIWRQQSNQTANQYFGQYQRAYTDYTRSQTLISSGRKDQARPLLQDIQTRVAKLKTHERVINHKLGNSPLPQGEPRTMSEFITLITQSIDEVDGLVKVNATTIANLPGKNATAKYMEIANGKAYIIDTSNKNALYAVGLSSGKVTKSDADLSMIGDVASTTISGGNDGIYILTKQPTVWFYRFDNDTIKQQTLAYGEWPPASAIGAYLSNIYLLSEGSVYKHVKNATGFSPKTTSINSSQSTSRATALAVDGAVYLASASGLHRYISGALDRSADMPQSLGQLTILRSANNGGLVIGVSPSTNRIGIWKATDKSLKFSSQISPGLKSLYTANYDAKTDQAYATSGSQLVKFPLP